MCLLVLLAIGTFVESKYNAEAAKAWVYKSIYLYSFATLLVVNLLFVMIKRWPWRKHHTGFLMAHIGLIILIIGALFTYKWGVDGSIRIPIGESERFVSLLSTEVSVFASFSGSNYSLIHLKPINFFVSPPEKKPLTFNLNDGKELKILRYHPFTLPQEQILPSDHPSDGPALRFQISNQRVNEVEWLVRPKVKPYAKKSLGPAHFVLSDGSYMYEKGHEIVLEIKKNSNSVYYKAFKGSSSKKKSKKTSSKQIRPKKEGWIKEGEMFQTPWMDLKFRLLRYYPKAKLHVNYKVLNQDSKDSVPAVLISFDGKEHKVGLNSYLRLFTEKEMYVFSFTNRRIQLDFELQLKDFERTYYPGTKEASSYESHLNVSGLGSVLVSMNRPFKHKGFTFYQSSFEENENKEVTASILSVNRDPGRFIKYVGSLLVILGSFILFYIKPHGKKIKQKNKKAS